MGPAAGLLPKYGGCPCVVIQVTVTGHPQVVVTLLQVNNPLKDIPQNKGPPTKGMDLEREKG